MKEIQDKVFRHQLEFNFPVEALSLVLHPTSISSLEDTLCLLTFFVFIHTHPNIDVYPL